MRTLRNLLLAVLFACAAALSTSEPVSANTDFACFNINCEEGLPPNSYPFIDSDNAWCSHGVVHAEYHCHHDTFGALTLDFPCVMHSSPYQPMTCKPDNSECCLA